MDGGKSRWELPKEKCHDKCYLSQLPVHMIGGPELSQCEQIDKSSQLCRKCNCHYSLHLHLYYSLKWGRQEDQCVVSDPGSPTEILSVMEALKENMNKLINVYNDQKMEIVTNLAQFAHFIENTSIIPCQTDYDGYIQTLINRAEHTLVMGDAEDKIQLLKLQSMFRDKKKDYDTALTLQRKLNKDFNLLTSITPQKIMGNVIKLYNLDNTGKKIRQLIKAQKAARQNEHEESIVNLVEASVGVQISKETKNDNKRNIGHKEESSASKNNRSESCEQKPNAVNNTNSSEKPGKVDVGKNIDKTKNNKKKGGKVASKEKTVKPVGGGGTSTTTVVRNKPAADTKPYKSDKNNVVRAPPPSYETVMRSQKPSDNMYTNLSHTAGFSANAPLEGHPSSSQTVEIKIFNTPHSASGGNHSIHGAPNHSGFPHPQQDLNFHPNNPHRSSHYDQHHTPHGSFPHGPMPQGPLPHGHLPHGPLPFQPVPHEPSSHGYFPHGSVAHGPRFMGPPPAASCDPSQFYCPRPHTLGYPGHDNLPSMHDASQKKHRQGVPLHHGQPGPVHTAHSKHSYLDAKNKPFDKKEQVKFKRNLKKKLKNNNPKKEQVMKKTKADTSSSSSSSDSD